MAERYHEMRFSEINDELKILFIGADSPLVSQVHIPTIDTLASSQQLETWLHTNTTDMILIAVMNDANFIGLADAVLLQNHYRVPIVLLCDSDAQVTQCLTSDIFETMHIDELTPRTWHRLLRHAHRLKQQQYDYDLLQQAQIELEESNHLIERIFRTMQDAVNVFDIVNTRHLYGNHRIAERLGYSPQEIAQMGVSLIDVLIHPDDVPMYRAYQREVIASNNQQITRIEFRMKNKQGGWSWVQSDYTIFRRNDTGKPIEILGVARDITEQKIIEEQLAQNLRQSEELSALKTQFITVTSHEFRTPLAKIQLSAETLTRYFDRLTDEQRNKKLDNIVGQVQHMTKLLNDLLYVARANEANLPFTPQDINLPRFTTSLIDAMNDIAKSTSKFQLVLDSCKPILRIEPTLLTQILDNLLSNAHKYTPDTGTVELAIGCNKQHLTFTVRDNGIGIPQSNLRHIFTSFYRGDNVSDYQGTGLGLSIVQQAVEAYRGTITVESELGVGTTFTITLPVLQT